VDLGLFETKRSFCVQLNGLLLLLVVIPAVTKPE